MLSPKLPTFSGAIDRLLGVQPQRNHCRNCGHHASEADSGYETVSNPYGAINVRSCPDCGHVMQVLTLGIYE
ncbi:hypothetical protein [Halobellus salinisoli]|uniref:hypothetical protein n=1 Tax=Halobellus salinisoli TaxID=3108500 RepID=UPI003008C41A